MSFRILKYSFLALFLLFLACKDDEIGTVVPVVEEMEEEMEEVNEPEEEEEEEMQAQYLTLDSDYLFDQDKFLTFELILSEENLAFLDNDPAAEEYVEGSLKFEGETVSPVGIRYKGSIGAFVGCVSGSNWFEPSGYKTCPKLSMKIKINWENSSDKFYGLKKLQFHSMNQDPSQMRERLGYHLFRSMGVAAPRCVHIKLLINGQFTGVYTLVEQIDGRFADYHFEDGTGNVYKEIWPLRSNGQAWPDQSYKEALKTNEEEANVDLFKSFAQELSVSNEGNVKEVIEKYMDVKEALAYCVVDRVIKHDDGPFHWYCGGGDCNPHNFYFYESPSAAKVHLVPWDLDHSFTNYTSPNAVTLIPDDWGEISNNCQPFSNGFFGLQQKSAACDKLINGWVQYSSEFEQIKQEFKQGPMSQNDVDALLVKWQAQIGNTTEEAYQIYGSDAISSSQWMNSVEELKIALTMARNN